MVEVTDPYKVLQVDPEAEDEVIQAAYRRLARKYHPDLAESPDAATRMAAINAAWEMIGEPDKRKAFDEQRAAERKAAAAAAAAAAKAAPPPPRPSGSGLPQRQRSPSGSSRPGAPEPTSPDFTSGRSSHGGGYDETMRKAEGEGAAGPPPGRPSGTVINFGRYAGWSIGEVARYDMEYIEWLDRTPIGRNFRAEIDEILRTSGRRRSEAEDERRGLYRRR